MDHVYYPYDPGIHVQKEKTVKKEIAFFDFDGTITKKDTLIEFIRFSKGVFGLYLGLVINSPYLIAYKLNIISNQQAKQKILQYFFKDISVKQFNKICEVFSKEKLPMLLRHAAVKEIRTLQNKNFIVVIVSASPENWITFWAKQMNVILIATQLEEKNNNLTGNILGNNCYGIEKVNRIKKLFQLAEYNIILAYGDTKGDIPMLNLATTKHFKPFR